jgi:hypothetical protein
MIFPYEGKSDILWQNTSGAVSIWQMDGTNATLGVLHTVNPSWHSGAG